MPIPKNVAQFPSQWTELIRAVSCDGRRIVVSQINGAPLTKSRAAQLRFRFYNFRSALRRDLMQQDLFSMSEGVEVTLEPLIRPDLPPSWSVVFSLRDKNSVALALEDALKGA